jgi:hypothetical protein
MLLVGASQQSVAVVNGVLRVRSSIGAADRH